KTEAKSLIKRLFGSVQRCENETDWKHLQDFAKPDAASRTAAQEDR
ncbi:ATP-dependent DNA helicase Q5 isoform X1, partial [Tachysurus ichikawai]